MALGPINYMEGFPPINLAQQFTQGLQAGVGIQQVQQQRLAQEQAILAAQEKQRRDQEFSAEFSDYLSKPNATKWAALVGKNPGMREALGDINKTLSADQSRIEQRDAAELYSALGTDVNVAKSMVEKRIDAAKNSNQPTDELEAIRDAIETSPSTVRALALQRAASLPGGDTLVKSLLDAEENERKRNMQPIAKREAEAKAVTAEAVAANAPEAEKQKALGIGFDAVIKEEQAKEAKIRAQYTPQRVKLEVEKLGADLGLTRAQTAQAGAAAAASRASTAASESSAARDRAGILPPDKRMEGESKLRKEYSDQTKTFQDVRESYRRVNASQDNAVGDLSLIFGFMKMLDPGSVVREGEFATAQNAAGIPVRLQNLYNKALRGERLTQGQRDAFKGQAQQLYGAAEKQEKVVRDGLGKVASVYGLDTKNIFFDQPKEAPPTPAPAAAGKPPSQAEVEAALSKYLPKPK